MSAIGLGMLAAAMFLGSRRRGRVSGSDYDHEQEAETLLSGASRLRMISDQSRDDSARCFLAQAMAVNLDRASQEMRWVRDQRQLRKDLARLRDAQRELMYSCDRTQVTI